MALISLDELFQPFYFIPLTFLLLLLGLLAYLLYSGLCTRIQIDTKEPTHGDLTVAYKVGRGPYKNTGELFEECQKKLPNRMQIGIYYDDPESVPEEHLRYAVGSVVAKNDEIPDADEVRSLLSCGYKIAYFPKPNFAVMVSFPFRTFMSVYIAIFRVYPKLKDYIFNRGLCAYPAIELYSKTEIQFLFPLSRQEEFFVPEFSDELISNATTEQSSHADFGGASIHEAETDEPRSASKNETIESLQETTESEAGDSNVARIGETRNNKSESPRSDRLRPRPVGGPSKYVTPEEDGDSSSSFEDLSPERQET